MKKLAITLFSLYIVCATIAQQPPKREFRGTWIHTVGNSDYPKNDHSGNAAALPRCA